MLCTGQWESVRGLPPRDGTVTCVDTRPCSRALCGLGVFICGPDLPLRGGGEGGAIAKGSDLGDALGTKLPSMKRVTTSMPGGTLDPVLFFPFYLKLLPALYSLLVAR